eukprot:CAMPEP_0117450900 /NCGR_PEP_ID=MMETSP0759-20121206/8718_1 /TAXON_ID=63605 /ORGANISM="Percolomonas cosmopolitus, Strain WS" /LENGTH=516 /DNA_ID=CAMNT_0005243459 /DNA_START=471 /DNA_END=2021 /DNA_ORIENTATION=+
MTTTAENITSDHHRDLVNLRNSTSIVVAAGESVAPPEKVSTTGASGIALYEGVNKRMQQPPQQQGDQNCSSATRKYSKEDFEFSTKLGTGAYSTVYLTKFLLTGKKYATKVISKKLILKENKIKTIRIEKKVLNIMNHPNIISLFCTYQDKENLYFVLELAPGGEMFNIISKYGPLTMEACQFYTAELVLGLEYMHSSGIIHRDLKPENIILSRTMHTKVTDFGTAKLENDEVSPEAKDSLLSRRKGTFCGTAEFVSPEILRDEPVTMSCDLWALGCIIYQYLTGRHPFKAESEYLIFQKILQKDMQYPDTIPPIAKDLIDKLLQLKPEQRLGFGANGYEKLKSHPFFNGVDWDSLNSSTPPEIIPQQHQGHTTKKSGAQSLTSTDKDNRENPKERLRRKTLTNISEEDRLRWAPFLLKGEVIIHTSQIVKRRRLSAKKRQLILTDHPRLLYIDTTKNVIKGSIPFTEELRVERRSPRFFNIRTPGRTYVLECVQKGAEDWVKHITECITILSKRA